MQLGELIRHLRKTYPFVTRERIYTAIHSQHVPEPERNERNQYDFSPPDVERLEAYFANPPKRGRPAGVPGR